MVVMSSSQPGPSGNKPVVNERKAGSPLIDRRKLLTGAAVSTIALTGCPCPICKPLPAEASAWSYGGFWAGRPERWGRLGADPQARITSFSEGHRRVQKAAGAAQKCLANAKLISVVLFLVASPSPRAYCLAR